MQSTDHGYKTYLENLIVVHTHVSGTQTPGSQSALTEHKTFVRTYVVKASLALATEYSALFCATQLILWYSEIIDCGGGGGRAGGRRRSICLRGGNSRAVERAVGPRSCTRAALAATRSIARSLARSRRIKQSPTVCLRQLNRVKQLLVQET